MGSLVLSHEDYTVAWVCALPLEVAAAKAMLDEVHNPLSQPPTDHNAYIIGRLSGHNIVIACLPYGVYGTTSAATVIAHLLATFPSIRFGLMVGIGGGVPSKTADVRLGDVVVSKPTVTCGGVIQYDYGKSVQDGRFQRTSSLNRAPQVLLTAMAQMEAEILLGKSRMSAVILEALRQYPEKHHFDRLGADWLFDAAYKHEGDGLDCTDCDKRHLVSRSSRSTDGPYVHYGLIASGNSVMKDARMRDQLAQELGVLCFEMEAAGLMDQLPCLVIRGICDYCDSHKSKQWQRYAAVAAAAYGKLLLSIVPLDPPAMGKQKNKTELNPEEQDCLRRLFITDPQENRNALQRRKGGRAAGTCEWMLESSELRRWLGLEASDDSNGTDVLWLYGNPGTGKSTMAIMLAEELANQTCFQEGNKVLAYFFCDSTSDTQRTALAILRGLLYQLIKQRPALMKWLFPRYIDRKDNIFASFDTLWATLMDMGQDAIDVEIYCMIDALDECEPGSQDLLLSQITQTFRVDSRNPQRSTSHIHLLIMSRPYSTIKQYMSDYPSKNLGTYPQVKGDLDQMISEKIEHLNRKCHYTPKISSEVARLLREKAEGTFLWVGIACDALERTQSRNAIKTLLSLPAGLHSLYKQLLETVHEDSDADDTQMIIEMLSFVAFSQRPLSVGELCGACRIYPEDDEESRIQFTKEFVDMCRLMIVIDGAYVRLLHSSVKDFMVKEAQEIEELESHAKLAYRCIGNVIETCQFGLDEKPFNSSSSFSKYAYRYWPEHAGLARNKFVVRHEHEKLFQGDTSLWGRWIHLTQEMYQDDMRRRLEGFPSGQKLVAPREMGVTFSTLHAAARWGITPLASWILGEDGIYIHWDFEDDDSVTPLEEAIRAGQTSTLNFLLQKTESALELGRDVVRFAADVGRNGKEVMALLLDTPNDIVKFTEDAMSAIISMFDEETVKLLLSRHGARMQDIQVLVEGVAGNAGYGLGVMTALLDNWGDRIQPTERLVRAVAANWSGNKLMTLLLNRLGDRIQDAEAMASTIIELFDDKLVGLFLNRHRDHIQITEKLIETAVRNDPYGKKILSLLLESHVDQLAITEGVMCMLVGLLDRGQVELLLDRHGIQVPITEEVVKATARNDENGEQILGLFLSRRAPITDDILQTAAGNTKQGKQILALLLDQPNSQLRVTENVLKTAATNRGVAMEVMTFLLGREEHQITITEDVLKAAASNNAAGNHVLALLLHRQGDKIHITEEVLKTAVANASCADEIITLLLRERGDETRKHITEEVLKAAAMNPGNGAEILPILINERRAQVHITSEVLEAAAQNWWSGDKVVRVLLEVCAGEIQITGGVIKAAVGNVRNKKEIQDLLLDQKSDCWDVSAVWVIFLRETDTIFALRLLEKLGDRTLVTKEACTTASELSNTEQSMKALKPLLVSRMESQIRSSHDELAIACWEGDVSRVNQLLSHGSDVTSLNAWGWTTLHIACWNGHTEIVNLLLAKGAHFSVSDQTGWSPLDAAYANGHIGVARVLYLHSQNHRRVPKTWPSTWDRRKGSSNLVFDDDGLGIRYLARTKPSWEQNHEQVSVHADYPINPLEDEFYFEVSICQAKTNEAIAVGLCKEYSPLDYFPGWDPVSWGYHGDDATKHHDRRSELYGDRFGEGDVISCRLKLLSGTLEFGKNGCFYGVAYTGVYGRLFPVI
ncbi:hypothetical protein BBP40_000575 [Aspergillus hancockii]|nr:hypothetical protein BBP40_000575 [Aspergillus hancockii]